MPYLVTFQSHEAFWGDNGWYNVIRPVQNRTVPSLFMAKEVLEEEAEHGCNGDCSALYGTIELDGKIIHTEHWGGQPAGFFPVTD